MKTYTITEEQLNKIRSALYLARYFVEDTGDGFHNVEQWESDSDTYQEALQVYNDIRGNHV